MSATATRAMTVIVGPAEHGVVQHASAVAAAVGGRTIHVDRSEDVAPIDGADADVVHLHYTDQLFGPDTTSAATAFAALARRINAPIVVTLHDLPLLDGTARSARRARTYGAVAAAATTAIVSSESERRRLGDHAIVGAVAVIPLPVREPASMPERSSIRAGTAHTPVVGILGFIYPGKGHDEVIDALATVDRGDAVVVAIGRASDGHEDLVPELAERARQGGHRFVTTGYLDDTAVAAWLASVDVAVAPATQPSASASLHAWIGAGRRPLVAASPYACEIAAHGDHLVTLYPPSDARDLAAAIGRALDDPASTWRTGPPPPRLTMAAVADAHRAVYAKAARGG
ncbi:MAG: glycosyltransferase family 4 protein [Ilumatobacteraceae bacterium]